MVPSFRVKLKKVFKTVKNGKKWKIELGFTEIRMENSILIGGPRNYGC